MIRENELLESYKSLKENREKRAQLFENSINKRNLENKKFMKNYYSIRESREARDKEHGKLLNEARNEAFADVLKAIYITAIEAATLTDDGLLLAESMVDSYIKENGGAFAILNKSKNDTYLLAKIARIVEDTAEAEVEDIESINDEDLKDTKVEYKDDEEIETPEKKESDATTDNEKIDNSEDEKSSEDLVAKLEKLGYKVEKKEESSKEETTPIEDNSEDENVDSVDSGDETEEDLDNDGDPDIDIDGDGEDDFDIDEPDDTVNLDPKQTMFQELEKEKEVKDAIELIRTRVADAEQAFINRNAADKKKIDQLLSKISNNINTVEKIANDDDTNSKIAKENAVIAKRKIDEITNNKPLTIFERMTRNLTGSIIKNESIKDKYLTESGEIDTPLIIESSKVMYAFLETLNTLQLEDINSKYIQNILSNMN